VLVGLHVIEMSSMCYHVLSVFFLGLGIKSYALVMCVLSRAALYRLLLANKCEISTTEMHGGMGSKLGIQLWYQVEGHIYQFNYKI
jgi:hypothetical protein